MLPWDEIPNQQGGGYRRLQTSYFHSGSTHLASRPPSPWMLSRERREIEEVNHNKRMYCIEQRSWVEKEIGKDSEIARCRYWQGNIVYKAIEAQTEEHTHINTHTHTDDYCRDERFHSNISVWFQQVTEDYLSLSRNLCPWPNRIQDSLACPECFPRTERTHIRILYVFWKNRQRGVSKYQGKIKGN